MSIGKNPFDPAMEHGSGQHSEASPHRRAHSKRRQYAGLTSPPQGRNLAKVFRSAAVMERNPFSFKMRSQALTVKGCPTSARVSTNGRAPSVFLKETDVFLGMGFEITDGMLKNLFPTRLQKPVLCKRSASQSKNILVGGSVRTVVSRRAMPHPLDLRQQNNAKGNRLSPIGFAPRQDRGRFQPNKKFLLRHVREFTPPSAS